MAHCATVSWGIYHIIRPWVSTSMDLTAPTSPNPETALLKDSSSINRLQILAFCGTTFSVLAAQVIISRLFAGTLGYYYAFMLVSLAMLGLSAGGLIVHLGPKVFSAERFGAQAALLSIGMGIAGFLGPLGMLLLYPKMNAAALDSGPANNFWPLAGVFCCVFPYFLAGGLIVSLTLGHGRQRFAKLYAVDLVSAAIGCTVAVLLLSVLTPIEAMIKVFAIIPLVCAALFSLSDKSRWLPVTSIVLALVGLVLGTDLSRNPEIAKPPHIRALHWKTYVNEWNTFSSVRVHPGGFFSWCLSPTYTGPRFPMFLLMIDGVGGTSIVQFDGHPESLQNYAYLDYDLTALDHVLVPSSGRQLIIGPGGGFDVLQSVKKGCSDITIVEINPLVARVVNKDLATFSGSPYTLPGVHLHIENGRTFVKRSNDQWNLMTLTWVDTGGSPHAVTFSENYLYTVEAYVEYFEHLMPDGIFSFTRALDYPALKVDSLRGISVAVEALRKIGVENPGSHMIIAASSSPFFMKQWTMCHILIKKSAFTDEEVRKASEFIRKLGFQAMWLPGGDPSLDSVPSPYSRFAPLIRQIVTEKDRDQLYENAAMDITPTTDDNPFYFVERAGNNRKAGIGVKDLTIYLAIQALLVIPFLVLPLVPRWKDVGSLGGPGIAALLYFCLLGAAFMLVEIEFFNVFSLLLGNPTITLATVLSALLVFSGIGSLVAGSRIVEGSNYRLPVAFGGLILSLLFFVSLKGRVLSALITLPLVWRTVATVCCIAPLGFFMGIPMPAGMTLIRSHRGLTLWGWALNGVLSVFATTAALYLAMNIGIACSFLIGLGLYALAGATILYLKKGLQGQT